MLQRLLAFVQSDGRIAPAGIHWDRLYRLLLVASEGEADRPALPLILGGADAPDALKRERLREHIRWAAQRDWLGPVDAMLRALPLDAWECDPNAAEIPRPRTLILGLVMNSSAGEPQAPAPLVDGFDAFVREGRRRVRAMEQTNALLSAYIAQSAAQDRVVRRICVAQRVETAGGLLGRRFPPPPHERSPWEPLEAGFARIIHHLDATAYGHAPNRVAIAIQVDGEDDTPQAWSHPSVHRLLQEKRRRGWRFLLFGRGGERLAAIRDASGIPDVMNLDPPQDLFAPNEEQHDFQRLAGRLIPED